MAFNLGNEQGFYWLDGYGEITSEELLCGYSTETKIAVAALQLKQYIFRHGSLNEKPFSSRVKCIAWRNP